MTVDNGDQLTLIPTHLLGITMFLEGESGSDSMFIIPPWVCSRENKKCFGASLPTITGLYARTGGDYI